MRSLCIQCIPYRIAKVHRSVLLLSLESKVWTVRMIQNGSLLCHLHEILKHNLRPRMRHPQATFNAFALNQSTFAFGFDKNSDFWSDLGARLHITLIHQENSFQTEPNFCKTFAVTLSFELFTPLHNFLILPKLPNRIYRHKTGFQFGNQTVLIRSSELWRNV